MNKNLDFEEIAQAYQVFGLAPGAPFDDIKKEYRNLALVFHPDKYEAGSTRQKWAQDKLIQINNAYDLLKEFYAKYPDGIKPNGWDSKNTQEAQVGDEPASSTEEETVDWKEWESQGSSDDFSLEEWEKRQELRQKKLKQEHAENSKAKFILYAKVAAVIFVFMLWSGRVTNHDLQKTTIDSNLATLRDKQKYEKEHQGTSIDGLYWSNTELEQRFAEQDAQLIGQFEANAAKTELTGWCTVIFTLIVFGAVAAGIFKKFWSPISTFLNGGKNETA